MTNKTQDSLIRRQNQRWMKQEKKKVNGCVCPQDSAPVPDEGLRRVLTRAPSSLSPIADLLERAEDEGGCRLLQVEIPPGGVSTLIPDPSSLLLKSLRLSQALSSELDALATELTCQRSKASGIWGAQQCLDDAFRVLSVIRASVAFREKRLSDLRQVCYHGYKLTGSCLTNPYDHEGRGLSECFSSFGLTPEPNISGPGCPGELR